MSSTTFFRTEAGLARPNREPSSPVAVDTSLGSIQLHIGSELQPLEAIWKELQAISPCTGAQTFDWAQAWTCHVLGPEGNRPVIVLGTGADRRPLFLWAFEMARCAGMSLLQWLGRDHANYKMGLFAPGIAAALTAGDMSKLLAAVAHRTGAAAACLEAQPFSFDGLPNPFAKLPHQFAPSSGYATTLGDFTPLYEQRFGNRSRSGLNRKERKLAALGTVRYGWAETREEKLDLIETFFRQKARQLTAMGANDIFDTHARAFYREIALLDSDNPSCLRMGYVRLGDEVLATFNGTIGHQRLLIVVCSMCPGEFQRYSPGALLIRHQIEEACAKGLAYYDFGAGSGTHKEQWSDTVTPLFDNFIAFKVSGFLLTLPFATLSSLKRSIKSNPRLWSLAQTVRARIFGRS